MLLAPDQRAVLGPSEDGGYYLIGLQQPHAHLFEEITWSTSVVSSQTIQRATEIQLPVELLREWYDVDDANSLARLHAEFFDSHTNIPKGYPAPESRAYLAKLPAFVQGTQAAMESPA